MLQQLTEKLDDGIILEKGTFSLPQPGVAQSYVKTLDYVWLGVLDWPLKVCKRLRNNIKLSVHASSSSSKPIRRAPLNYQLFHFFSVRFFKRFVDFFRRQIYFEREKWNIGYVDSEIGHFIDNFSFEEVTWLPDRPYSQFIADPFTYKFNNSKYLICESYDYNLKKAELMKFHYDKALFVEDESMYYNHHISYPYPFEVDGEIYIIPEKSGTGTTDIIKLKSSLSTSEIISTIDIPMIDPTLFFYKGIWWIFYTLNDIPNDIKKSYMNVKLHAIYSDSFKGPWIQHKLNPLKTDVTSSRPAGQVFEKDGSLFFPTQDCSKTYGSAITINKINHLSPENFEDEFYTTLRPDENSIYNNGVHTMSFLDDRIFIDAKYLQKVVKYKRLVILLTLFLFFGNCF